MKEAIITNLHKLIDPDKFNKELLACLRIFDNKPIIIKEVVVQSENEVIANKLSQETKSIIRYQRI